MRTRISKNKKALICFITAGDPNLATTEKIVTQLEKAGADLVELGVPFSDPMADGPVIQASSERALKKGITLKDILGLVKKIRRRSQIPILLMGYYNPIYSYGLERYAREAAHAGVNGTLVVDLPPEESDELDRELKKVGLDLIYLLSPTSDEKRIRLVTRKARGFIYFVSVTGITGAKISEFSEVEKKVRQIRQFTKLPIAVGFGISELGQVKKVAQFADGVVVGSALVKRIYEKPSSLESFVFRLKVALDRA